MGGPLCLFWLCQGGSVASQGTAADRQEADVPFHLVWEWLAICSTMLVAFVLALALKWLTQKQKFRYQRGAKEHDLGNAEELKSRLLQALSQMEQELVKLMTLIRNRKASLVTQHHGCRSANCQRLKENKDFNMAVYDIFEN